MGQEDKAAIREMLRRSSKKAAVIVALVAAVLAVSATALARYLALATLGLIIAHLVFSFLKARREWRRILMTGFRSVYECLLHSHEINNEWCVLSENIASWEVAGSDGHLSRILKGRNGSDRTVAEIKVYQGGDTRTTFERMNFRGRDMQQNISIRPRLAVNEETYKIWSIPFGKPIESGETFEIEYSLTWPGAFTLNKEYIFLNLLCGTIARSVEKAVLKVRWEKDPRPVSFFRLTKDMKMEFTQTQPPVSPSANEGKFGFEWVGEKPEDMYCLVFHL